MSNLEHLRPYRDDEVPTVLDRIMAHEHFFAGAAALFAPGLHRLLPGGVEWVVGQLLKRRLGRCRSVADVQRVVALFLERLVERTTDGLSCTGAEGLPDGPCVFVSNHRDIALDSSLLDLLLHRLGRVTCRLAVGDNLFRDPLAADLIRLNKGFVVERGVGGGRAAYRAMSNTAQLVRQGLESGDSVWIAQRDGRAKDGLDATEPALIKMLMLAYRKECADIGAYLARVHLVPVTLSYELDPCDLLKAQACDSAYEKRPGDDLEHLRTGLSGAKGRVHIAFGRPLSAPFDSAEAWAREMDRAIAEGSRLYPTHREALIQLGEDAQGLAFESVNRPALNRFRGRLAACEPTLRPHVLLQYANAARAIRATLEAPARSAC